ncbi:MAG: DNA translocase FtsK [Bacillales bacterium]|nr:DNA translocase FtsK [Bacillales bacterium]
MSWLKRFMKLFIDEEVVEMEESDSPHVLRQILKERTDNLKKNPTKPVRELKTRIAYHYPQKPLSLPIVSEKIERKTLERHNRHRRNEPTKPEPKPTTENLKSASYHVSSERKGNRPFRPTNIPSPIYGYKRPSEASQSKVVEYELKNSFVEGEVSVHTETLKRKNENFEELKERNQTLAVPFKNEEKQAEPSVKEQEAAEKEQASLEENHLKDEAAFNEFFNWEDSPLSTKQSSQENNFPTVEEAATEECENVRKMELVEEQNSVVRELDISEDSNQEQRPETVAERADKPNKTRPHLPFNVLMLKQDKKKLEKKNILNDRKGPDMAPSIHKTEKEQTKDIEKENGHQLPDINFLTPPVEKKTNEEWIQQQIQLLNDTLKNFRVRAKVVNVTEGPSVTRFEVQPEPGVKVNKITNLSDDIKLSLAAKDIRIEAPIPGKHTIGIEVPNKESRPVYLSEIIMSPSFQNSQSPLTIAMGLDISGQAVVTDLKKMPHGLIAGATGSGKSVCINSILISLLYKTTPEELKLLLIDPKMVELAPYNGIGHLVSPVITDVKAATQALKWAVVEMERRYELFAHAGVRNIERFNQKALESKEKRMPYIVIVIDELADLMMMSPADVEEAICRIAQKARACGIHLLVATQRPSVDVITGLIKANIPTRIAFSVSSQADSRTILDSGGAEKLLGKGDMLFLDNGTSKTVRLQGSFVSDGEIERVVSFVKEQWKSDYLFLQEELVQKANFLQDEDDLFKPACEFVVRHGGASASLLQRHFRIGYNRAARLIERMEEQGIISEQKPGKPRDVLITEEDFDDLKESSPL